MAGTSTSSFGADEALRELSGKTTVGDLRAVRRKLSAALKGAEPGEVLKVVDTLIDGGFAWVGWEVISVHQPTIAALTRGEVERLAGPLGSWYATDTFGPYVAGPAWDAGRISDADVLRWTTSKDLWWRRLALVATTVLNNKSRGGTGDTRRTLAVAERLVADREDMVVKAMSWALRMLATWDPGAVRAFLAKHEADLAARVKREVRTKLETGRKTGSAEAAAKANTAEHRRRLPD